MIPERARRALAAGSTVVVAAAVGIGLWQIGPPGQARLRRLDEQRSRDLAALDAAIRRYARARGALPRSLDDLPTLPDATTDPASGTAYEYRAEGTDGFSLCATFATAETERAAPRPLPVDAPDYRAHDAGLVCFTSRLSPVEGEEPGPPRVAPLP